MVVDDSVLIRKYVSQVLTEISDVEVIGTAPNGKIALKKLYLYHPDVIILDLEMPEMSGIQFLRYLKEQPQAGKRPRIIILSSIAVQGSAVTFEALGLGADDFITKPQGQVRDNVDFLRKELDIKIHSLHHTDDTLTLTPKVNVIDQDWEKTNTRFGISNLTPILEEKKNPIRLVAVGSSTGGPNAIRKIMETLGPLPVPMLIAQHMPPAFTQEFASNLGSIFKRDVREARPDDKLENGVIYICPGGFHSRIITVGKDIFLTCDAGEIDGFFFKPSVDIFFKSIHQSLGGDVLGLILSGMGKDGSLESAELRARGAIMIAQDQASSVVWGMPGSSVKSNGIDIILPVNEIGEALNRCLQKS